MKAIHSNSSIARPRAVLYVVLACDIGKQRAPPDYSMTNHHLATISMQPHSTSTAFSSHSTSVRDRSRVSTFDRLFHPEQAPEESFNPNIILVHTHTEYKESVGGEQDDRVMTRSGKPRECCSFPLADVPAAQLTPCRRPCPKARCHPSSSSSEYHRTPWAGFDPSTS